MIYFSSHVENRGSRIRAHYVKVQVQASNAVALENHEKEADMKIRTHLLPAP